MIKKTKSPSGSPRVESLWFPTPRRCCPRGARDTSRLSSFHGIVNPQGGPATAQAWRPCALHLRVCSRGSSCVLWPWGPSPK